MYRGLDISIQRLDIEVAEKEIDKNV